MQHVVPSAVITSVNVCARQQQSRVLSVYSVGERMGRNRTVTRKYDTQQKSARKHTNFIGFKTPPRARLLVHLLGGVALHERGILR